MIPTYNPTPLSLKFPDDDSKKAIFIAVRESAYGRGSGGWGNGGGGVENNSRHVWLFWDNYSTNTPASTSDKQCFPQASPEYPPSPSARQVLQLERHGSEYIYLEPNIVLPIVSSPYPFASDAAYKSASYYTPMYSGRECQVGMENAGYETRQCRGLRSALHRNGRSGSGPDFDDNEEKNQDRIYPLGHFSRDERELILTLAADIDINQYLHGKGDQFGRGNGWSNGASISLSDGGSDTTNEPGLDDTSMYTISASSQSSQNSCYHFVGSNRASGSNGSGMVNGSRVWARELLGNMVEEGLIDRATFLRVVEMVPLPR